MDNEIKKLLKDILICIDNIDTYIGTERSFAIYQTNFLLQDAVERNLITIGEAVNALLKRNSSIKITDARKIVNTRNKLTHGYDEIENVQVWNIIINSLPILKTEAESLINQ